MRVLLGARTAGSALALAAALGSVAAQPARAADEPTALIDKQGDVVTFRDPDGLTQNLDVIAGGSFFDGFVKFVETGDARMDVPAGSACVVADLAHKQVRCPTGPESRLDVQLREGDDDITFDATGDVPVRAPALVQGGPGDDGIRTGLGNDDLRGNEGDDFMDARSGDDFLTGGPGADDQQGAGGTDLVRYDDGHENGVFGVVVTISDGLANDGNSLDEGEGGSDVGKRDNVKLVEALRATDGRDRITSSASIPFSLTVRGLAGDDVLAGAEGDEVLIGDEGNDQVQGGGGADRLFGDAGLDVLRGDEGEDRLTGGTEADRLGGGPGFDSVDYRNQVFPDADLEFPVSVTVGDGLANDGGIADEESDRRDEVLEDVEQVIGSPARDRLVAGPLGSTLLGVDGADELVGGPAADRFSGGGGEDVLLARDGLSETAACGDGIDSITADAPGVDTIDLDCETVAFPPDVTPPDTRITKAPKRPLKLRRARIRIRVSFAASEPGATFECKLGASAFRPCKSPLRLRLRKGRHVFLVRAIDSAGNVDPTPAKRVFRVRKR